MNVSGVQSMAPPPMMMGQPPSAEDLAQKMADSVENGEIDAETLVADLESRFDVDASSIVNEDGSIDVDALTELLSSNEPSASMEAGIGMAPPPPPPPEEGMLSAEELSAKLTEDFGEEAAATVVGEDGEIDFEALKALLDSQASSESGVLIETTA